MADRYLEDFRVGEVFETRGLTLTEAQIIDFALRYDPQPFHLDVRAAERSLFGGLIASGFQTLALTFRLFYDTGVVRAANLGGTGAEQVQWLKPVRPGDTLRVRVEVLEVVPSRSDPTRGRVRFAYTTYNQADEVVMTMVLVHIVARRPQ